MSATSSHSGTAGKLFLRELLYVRRPPIGRKQSAFRYEVNFRIAMFFSAATIAGAFGGLLARLINLMDGMSSIYEGCHWYSA